MSASSTSTADALVLGGGMLGLAAALRLAQAGRSVVLVERETVPGGLAAGFEIEPGMWLDKFYHHLFRSDRHAIALINELGLADDLLWPRPRTVTLLDGRLRQLDSPGSLLRFDALPIIDRMRMGATLAFLKVLPNPNMLEGTTAAQWLRGAMGERAYSVVWEPLLRGKFGPHADTIAMPWFWARVHDRSTELGYLRGGFQRLYDALVEHLTELGVRVELGASVERVERNRSGWLASTTAGDIAADLVISTLPTVLTARIVPELGAAWLAKHHPGRALGAHCLIVALDRPLTDAYWININDPGLPFMAAVEHTNYMDAADYGGRNLLYLGNYRASDDPLMGADKEQVLEAFLPHLAKLNPAFDPSWVTESWIFAAHFAQPIVDIDYAERIPPLRTHLPGLFVANMFGVYPHDRGQNYSVEMAGRVVDEALGR